MRILFFCHYFPPEVNAPASRTYAHALRWVQAGHDVTVITCVPNCPTGVVFPGYQNRMRPQVEMVDGIRVIRVWSYLAPNAGALRRILNFFSYMITATLASLFQKRPDVILATSPQFFCGWAGIFSSWWHWRPFVLEIRDIWPESIAVVGAMKKGLMLRCLERLEIWMYRSATHIVTVGAGYRDQILAKVPERKHEISVIPNGVDALFLTPAAPDQKLMDEYGLTGKFVVSYVGTIGMAHGLEVVIEAAALLRERGENGVGFLIVGEGARRAELQHLAQERGVSDSVIFPGRIPRDRVPGLLAASSACLIHLRKSDLFEKVIPSKIFETMALGRPIIMGVQGESLDIVLHAGAGIPMEPDSPLSLVRAIEQLKGDPELQQSCGRDARDFVLRYYDRTALADQLLETLQGTAGMPATPVPAGCVSASEPT